jgi:GTP pyrophosphokinase
MAAAAHSPKPFTKGEVNRAGELLRDIIEGKRAVAESDTEALARAWEALTWWRSLHARPLSIVAANLRYHVDREGGQIRGALEVAQRLKRLPTIVDKLAREQGRVTQMQDIGGVRAVLPSLRHVYAVRRRLLKTWTIVRVRDYIAEPKRSGYRALHVIVKRRGFPIEVQLRTIAQDVWANSVEEQGRESGVGFKFGAGGADVHGVLVGLSDARARFDRGEISGEELRVAMRGAAMMRQGHADD